MNSIHPPLVQTLQGVSVGHDIWSIVLRMQLTDRDLHIHIPLSTAKLLAVQMQATIALHEKIFNTKVEFSNIMNTKFQEYLTNETEEDREKFLKAHFGDAYPLEVFHSDSDLNKECKILLDDLSIALNMAVRKIFTSKDVAKGIKEFNTLFEGVQKQILVLLKKEEEKKA